MPLMALAQPGFLDIEQEGVVFLMSDGTETVSVLVSLHALEDIDAPAHTGEHLERFNEYRQQFEQIARSARSIFSQRSTIGAELSCHPLPRPPISRPPVICRNHLG